MNKFIMMAAVLVLSITGRAFAADDGNTKWRVNQSDLVWPNTSADIISTTNGAGNVKGVRCSGQYSITVSVYVNGGAAESFTFAPTYFANNDSGWIPFNIRFSSSIRVGMSRGSGSAGDHICVVSWGLD